MHRRPRGPELAPDHLPDHLPELPPELAPELAPAQPETLRYLRPEPPPLDDVARYYALAEDARFYSNGGPCCQRLASRLAAYVGEVSCVPVSNCTVGLMAALRATFGAPDPARNLVAVPSFTFTASACAIRWAGFEPLFVDVEPSSWQLDPAALDAALARFAGAVAGVLGCSTFGTPAPAAIRAGWHAACAAHALPLVVDSAAGFGALDEHGRRLGSQGDVEVFSFHATKPFAIGEGGAVITPDRRTAQRIEQIINFGIDRGTGTSVLAGINAKMSELHAAAGLAMLDRYDDVLARRRATMATLQDRFAAHPVGYQAGSAGSTWQSCQLMMPDRGSRERALSLAREHRIEVRTYFDPPLHRHPAFAAAPVADALTVTEQVAARTLSLPMANALGRRQITRLGRLIDAVFGGC